MSFWIRTPEPTEHGIAGHVAHWVGPSTAGRCERAAEYVYDGHLARVEIGPGRVEASVRGFDEAYTVGFEVGPSDRDEVWGRTQEGLGGLGSKALAFAPRAETSCSCPDQHPRCKHVLATATVVCEEVLACPHTAIRLFGLLRSSGRGHPADHLRRSLEWGPGRTDR